MYREGWGGRESGGEAMFFMWLLASFEFLRLCANMDEGAR